MADDVKVPKNWETSEQAVLAFRTFCTGMKWPNIEIPNQQDFGKDVAIDLTDASDAITGEMFAAQVKGGASYRRAEDYKIPVDKHARSWSQSSVPVIGIVQDPDDLALRWVNLTEALRFDPDQTVVGVPQDARLDDPKQVAALVNSVRSTHPHAHLPVGLGSTDIRDQADAVWQCFAVGRSSEHALVALRRTFLALDRGARVEGLHALACCTPHPDILWTKDNWLPKPIKDRVCASMRWTDGELICLMRLVDDETGLARGSIGQSIAMLILQDPDASTKLGELAVLLAEVDSDTAAWTVFLACGLSRFPVEQWASLVARAPALRATPTGDWIDERLQADGGYALFD